MRRRMIVVVCTCVRTLKYIARWNLVSCAVWLSFIHVSPCASMIKEIPCLEALKATSAFILQKILITDFVW